jgi:hypothetical protein
VAVASAYRAASQGIVYDEAATYFIFVAGPLEDVFTRYTANNHVLFTLLANATAGRHRITEPCKLIYVDPVSDVQLLQCARVWLRRARGEIGLPKNE